MACFILDLLCCHTTGIDVRFFDLSMGPLAFFDIGYFYFVGDTTLLVGRIEMLCKLQNDIPLSS